MSLQLGQFRVPLARAGVRQITELEACAAPLAEHFLLDVVGMKRAQVEGVLGG